jgi:hypothetical protein
MFWFLLLVRKLRREDRWFRALFAHLIDLPGLKIWHRDRHQAPGSTRSLETAVHSRSKSLLPDRFKKIRGVRF